MDSIRLTAERWGQCEFHQGNPLIRRVCNAYYIPLSIGDCWGLYDAAGFIVKEAVDLNASGGTNGQILTQQDPDATWEWAEHDNYIYVGRFNFHFGHFIINTLSRFWNFKDGLGGHVRLLCHGPGEVDSWKKFGFVWDILSQLGITVEDISVFSRPMRLKSVLVAQTSFIEQTGVYDAYADLCNTIGFGMGMMEPSTKQRDEPVYLSKSRLRAGVGRFLNEIQIEQKARKEGFRIVHPEELTFGEQIEILAEHSVLCGPLGSAFHNLVFSQPGKLIFALSPTNQINSNFLLIDGIKRNRSSYYVPLQMSYVYGGDFLTSIELGEPDQVAVEFVDAVLSGTVESKRLGK